MDICICITDSFCCATETNTTLYINYTLTKINLKKIVTSLGAVAQTVKNLPAMWETQVWFLSQEDPLEKGMATHS